MKGGSSWDGDEALHRLEAKSAEALLHMATMVQRHFMERLNVSNARVTMTRTRNTTRGPKGSTYSAYPNVSQEGEYLRAQTGWLKGHILIEPTLPAEVAQTGRVRVGYGESAFYGALWAEKWKKRKGLLAVVEELKDQLAILGGR